MACTWPGIRREDGTVTSYTVWTEGVPRILPRAAEIALIENVDDAAENVFRVRWHEVERLLARGRTANDGGTLLRKYLSCQLPP